MSESRPNLNPDLHWFIAAWPGMGNVSLIAAGYLVQKLGLKLTGEVAVRRLGNVSVTFDHRVVDGARAAAFCLAVIARLGGAGGADSPAR